MQHRNAGQARFMHDELRCRGERRLRTDEGEQWRDALICASGEREKPYGFRQPQRQDRNQQQRGDAADDKHRTPTELRNQCPPDTAAPGRAAARSPPSAAPPENPQNMIITMVARRRRGLNSDVMARAFGIAPPRPSRVRNRIASRVLTSWT